MPTPPSSPGPDRDRAVSELSARADALEQRTARPPSAVGEHGAAVSGAYRIIVELFGGVLVGLGLGFGVDRLAGTAPWGLIGGVLVGFALSIYLARRTANRLMAEAAAEQAEAQTKAAPSRGGEKN